jgi:hypothetical protein
MGSEERQREIREQGSRPGETERQERARSDREALERSNAEHGRAQPHSPDEPAPLTQDDEDRPTPRR